MYRLAKVDEQFVFVSIFEVVAECQILYGVPDLGGIVALFFALSSTTGSGQWSRRRCINPKVCIEHFR
jgi:hypothetical protein